ncbi:aspartate carbamoyltransferase catalytic subunit [Hazenella sp. IB182357]|uniref:Aspartate carbamoyltransferase n=1 Tax=Polycladospora coralii TaxID=2771432 RepID=A0A926N7W0_9BACL|nr:aspartate carbamoyltransferase catalytic subunit [Polycladospora coralii]MBD1371347.1 aspartate carbamoyltransferase catalytic subunit [Polycladospora coralii]
MRHFIHTDTLDITTIHALLTRAKQHEAQMVQADQPYRNRFTANLFFEPSTRTRCSFEVAQKRLGMEVIHLDTDTSSAVKGESLYDTIQTLSALGVEIVVMRHTHLSVYEALMKQNVNCALINAGAGKQAHPTQALLDLYTIQNHFGELDGLVVAMIGDITHSRVVRSNLDLMQRLGIQVILSGPENMRDPELERRAPYVSFSEAIQKADVVMMLRVQLERHQGEIFSDASKYCEHYGLTQARMENMKANAIILHPAPMNRGVEIEDACVEHERSRIFAQMRNGVYVRMAVLDYVLGGIKTC